jgi:hypothetical protein
MTFLLLRQSSDLTLAILRAAFSRRHKKRAQSPDSHSTEGLTALTRMLAERRAPKDAPNASTHSSQRNGQDSVEHMQRINANDDAVGGGEVRLRPRASSRQASSQPIGSFGMPTFLLAEFFRSNYDKAAYKFCLDIVYDIL